MKWRAENWNRLLFSFFQATILSCNRWFGRPLPWDDLVKLFAGQASSMVKIQWHYLNQTDNYISKEISGVSVPKTISVARNRFRRDKNYHSNTPVTVSSAFEARQKISSISLGDFGEDPNLHVYCTRPRLVHDRTLSSSNVLRTKAIGIKH